VVVVWRNGNALVLIKEVNLRRAWLVLGWVTVSDHRFNLISAGHLLWYATSYLSPLSLAILLWIGAMSTSQKVPVTPCGWE